MTRKDIIRELQRRGYEAESKDNIKNGVVFEGVVIGGNQISPIIYTKTLIEDAEKHGENVYNVATKIIEIYEQNADKEIPVDLLLSKEFCLNHIYIGIQKKSKEAIEKKCCELDPDGLENYLLIKYRADDGVGTMKVNERFLKMAGVTEEEAWDKAMQNICKDTVIESMDKIFSEAMGTPYDPDAEPVIPLYIIGSKENIKGASSILNREKLKEFGEKYWVKQLLVIPSSIHEMLISPYTDWMEMDQMKAMVREVNEKEVLPEERLTDQAYIVTL